MNKVKNFIPLSILRTIYNTLIVPHINYGILAWGTQCNRLVKLQKKAVRLIVNAKYNSHTEPIFKQLFLLKIQDIFALQELKFIFKIKNGMLPHYFLNLQYFRHSDVHSHNTRFSNYILPLQNQHVFVNKSICFRVPSILNNCPNIIKEKINTHSIKGYSNYIKKYYIEKYSAICLLNHCYSCTNNEIS